MPFTAALNALLPPNRKATSLKRLLECSRGLAFFGLEADEDMPLTERCGLQFVAPLGRRRAVLWGLYGRNAGYPAPPVQSRTCSFPASGSSVVLASAVQSRAFRQTLSDVGPPS